MKYIAGCSFGKDSLATLILAAKYNVPIESVVYCEVMFDGEISAEAPEHREFIYSKAIPRLEKMGYKIDILKSQKTYLDCFYHVIRRSKYPDLIGKYKGFPLAGRCYVQDRCKARTLDQYKKQFGNDTCQLVGITADEKKRIERLKPNQISLLEKLGVTQNEARTICKREQLYSPIYEFSKRGGCWFCPNASDGELNHIRLVHPTLWDRLIDLGKEESVATRRFNRTETVEALNLRLKNLY